MSSDSNTGSDLVAADSQRDHKESLIKEGDSLKAISSRRPRKATEKREEKKEKKKEQGKLTDLSTEATLAIHRLLRLPQYGTSSEPQSQAKLDKHLQAENDEWNESDSEVTYPSYQILENLGEQSDLTDKIDLNIASPVDQVSVEGQANSDEKNVIDSKTARPLQPVPFKGDEIDALIAKLTGQPLPGQSDANASSNAESDAEGPKERQPRYGQQPSYGRAYWIPLIPNEYWQPHDGKEEDRTGDPEPPNRILDGKMKKMAKQADLPKSIYEKEEFYPRRQQHMWKRNEHDDWRRKKSGDLWADS